MTKQSAVLAKVKKQTKMSFRQSMNLPCNNTIFGLDPINANIYVNWSKFAILNDHYSKCNKIIRTCDLKQKKNKILQSCTYSSHA